MRYPKVAQGFCTALTILSLFNGVEGVTADPRRAPLVAGYLPGDVAARWGSPSDKQEFEAARGEAWHYPPSTVIRFQEGRYSPAVSQEVVPQAISLPAASAPASARKPSRAPEHRSPEDVEKILGEIMENFPPSAEGSGVSPAAPAIPPPAMAPMGGDIYSPENFQTIE